MHAALTGRELQDVLHMLCDDEMGVPREDIEKAVSESRDYQSK